METGYVSPRRSTGMGDSSLSRSRSDVTEDRLLRGGVYSSPMPISKVKSSNRSLSFSKKSLSESQHSSPPPMHEHRPSSAAERPFDVRLRPDLSHRGEESVLMGDSLFVDSQLSMSTRINLREKHAKHLSDLREYYEAEMAELRSSLSATHTSSESAHERILREESQELKLRCQSLDDQLHDAKVRIRDLEQKLQGLEIRATDYSTRYDESQRTVLKLRGRVDELHSYVKDKDSQYRDLESTNRQQTQALKDAYKHQQELTESSRRDKEALKRLLDKYDDLEREHDILRGRLGDSDRKLQLSRQEVADRDKTISKLELHSKQLARENENLKHKAAIALSMASAKTSYEDSYGYSESHRSAEPNQGEIINGRTSAPYMSMERLYVSEPGGHRRVESSPESDVDSDSGPSPLLKAERELRRLQTDSTSSFREGFQPKLQKKFYGSEVAYPGRYREAASSSKLDSSRSKQKYLAGKLSNSPKPKNQSRNMSRSDTQINSVGTHNGILSPKRTKLKLQPKEQSTPTRLDVSLNNLTNGHDSNQKSTKDKLSRAKSEQAVPAAVEALSRSNLGGKSVESTLEKVRSGNYVSRPQWEDIDTSMARPAKSQTSPRQNMTREERLRERLQAVDKLERHYDDLQAEKRKLESALIKIPIHGRNRKMIQDQGELEGRLDQVDKELGSVRMSLKRFQVLKSTI
ncbi:M-phase phosphoprotein 9-like isoform X2 [Haliotis rubra]|uniref:M-phase phosphoprotein 9-like isoform X2 n=1 Tax=Haliotis rubra TaxID=36100 RepID=UPI001EE56A52|nr:M-phase phosphoprotein 9-like isoform X2 [Haliotis rubra]